MSQNDWHLCGSQAQQECLECPDPNEATTQIKATIYPLPRGGLWMARVDWSTANEAEATYCEEPFKSNSDAKAWCIDKIKKGYPG